MTKIKILSLAAIISMGFLWSGHFALGACSVSVPVNCTAVDKTDFPVNIGKPCCTTSGETGTCQQISGGSEEDSKYVKVKRVYACVASISTNNPSNQTTGCCAKATGSTGSAMACYPNYTKNQCKPTGTGNVNDIFIPDIAPGEAADCSGPVAQKTCKAQVDPSKKGCCVVIKSGDEPNCLPNLTEQGCRDTASKNSFQYGGFYNDSDCRVSSEQGRCRGNQTNNNLSTLTNPSNPSNPSSSNGLGTSVGITFTNPLRFDTVEGFLGSVLDALRRIIVVLSIIFIILGGVFYITSAGNEDRMKMAKGAITASMIGLAIGLAAPSFLKEIYNVLGGQSEKVDTSQLVGPTLSQIALNFLNFLLSVVGVIALIMMLIGGIMYLMSAGDEDRAKTAKKIVTYAIVGITVSLAALVIVKQVANLLK